LVAKPTMRVGEVIAKMWELKQPAVPVVDESYKVIGILSYRSVLLRGAGRDTKIMTVMDRPTVVGEDSTVLDSMNRIVLWKAKAVPVVDSSRKLVGMLTRFKLLELMLRRGVSILEELRVSEIMTSPAVTIGETESIARARWLMLRGGISRLPVIDANEVLVGVITLGDIAEKLLRIRFARRRGYEWLSSEEEFLAAPVRDFMSAPPIYVAPSVSLKEFVETLISNRISGVPVVERDKVAGVCSGLDVLKKYIEAKVSVTSISASLPEVEDAATRVQLEKLVNEYLSHFARWTDVINVSMNIKEESKTEKKEGRKRYRVRIVIETAHGRFSVENEGWELLSAAREALMDLERRIRRAIEKKATIRGSEY